MSSKYALFRLTVTLISIILSIGIIRSIWERRTMWAFVDRREHILRQEQEKNALLREKLREATSPAFIEKQAREKLGLARPEDTIVLMIPPAEEGSGSGAADESALTNLQRWWRLFF